MQGMQVSGVVMAYKTHPFGMKLHFLKNAAID
jgi:hypothetical protein